MQRHREQTAHLQAALLHSGSGAGPDTNRSAGLHSFAAVATTGAAQGLSSCLAGRAQPLAGLFARHKQCSELFESGLSLLPV